MNTIGKQRKKQGRLYAAEEKEREENGGSYTENMILQEIFIRQGIYFQPDFFKKTAVEETGQSLLLVLKIYISRPDFKRRSFSDLCRD